MTCHSCRIECRKFGKRKNRQRFQCALCHKVFTEPREDHLDGMYTSVDSAVKVLELLIEGMSVSSVERVTDIHHTTILTLLAQVGERCEKFFLEKVRNVSAKDVQCDELWGFIQKKEGHKWPHEAHADQIGDSYCFVAIERHSKLIISWHLGRRTSRDTLAFTEKVREATAGHFQITTDGFTPYRDAVEYSLGMRVDFAQLIKVYQDTKPEHRYSPGEVIGSEVVPVIGNPEPARICTSHVERQNLTMRMGIRRLTRLTNGFSKKWENHKAAIALHFAYYNFCRIHKTIRVTPAMEAGIADHQWTLRELVEALP